ncbi:MAG: TPM domain-containing protein [Thermovenabulum sp.]|uniref:TPM domain-containing protein n=1 Tax=Thermovenabulum sp. TaxID=3100335 RepID=UPI003C7B5258
MRFFKYLLKGKYFVLLIFLIIVLTSNFKFLPNNLLHAEPVPPKPAYNEYIFDFADLIDENQEEEMREIAKKIDDLTGAEIVVVTVGSLDGKTIEDYALELFRSWGIGDKEKNNGILILVNKENLLLDKKGRIRIEVGYGLEGAVNDGKAGYILDIYALPAFKEKNYSKGIYDTFLAVTSEVAKEYGVDLEKSGLSKLEGYKSEEKDSIFKIVIDIMLFFIILYFFFIMPRRIFRRRPPFGGGGGPIIRGPFDPFGGGGFGGFGGFSGGSGGGFGGFGGGSSGGGGASR